MHLSPQILSSSQDDKVVNIFKNKEKNILNLHLKFTITLTETYNMHNYKHQNVYNNG